MPLELTVPTALMAQLVLQVLMEPTVQQAHKVLPDRLVQLELTGPM
ncbi:MAG: hypothetical protein ACI835_005309, partial [Planctomycetota bacterium]